MDYPRRNQFNQMGSTPAGRLVERPGQYQIGQLGVYGQNQSRFGQNSYQPAGFASTAYQNFSQPTNFQPQGSYFDQQMFAGPRYSRYSMTAPVYGGNSAQYGANFPCRGGYNSSAAHYYGHQAYGSGGRWLAPVVGAPYHTQNLAYTSSQVHEGPAWWQGPTKAGEYAYDEFTFGTTATQDTNYQAHTLGDNLTDNLSAPEKLNLDSSPAAIARPSSARAPTPSSEPRLLGIDFISQPASLESSPAQQRPRKNSTSSLYTETVSRSTALENWVVEERSVSSDAKSIADTDEMSSEKKRGAEPKRLGSAPPPKMLNLLSSAGNIPSSILSPITEQEPKMQGNSKVYVPPQVRALASQNQNKRGHSAPQTDRSFTNDSQYGQSSTPSRGSRSHNNPYQADENFAGPSNTQSYALASQSYQMGFFEPSDRYMSNHFETDQSMTGPQAALGWSQNYNQQNSMVPQFARSLADPFGPLPSTIVPYSGSTLLRPANGMSNLLRNLTSNGMRKPTVAEAFDAINLPFVENCRLAKDTSTFGVIRISNIPYTIKRSEIMAFLGRNAKMVNETDHEPVHIVMERVTSKTLDCFVEFVNFEEALATVARFEANRMGGRVGRLGQRHVEVELSSQAELMKELFPKVKNVTWEGARPVIAPRDFNDKYNSGFQGFVTKEELVMLVKHVESPNRSPFAKDCPQRPFECLISTLIKYPWYMVDYITIEDRNLIHSATKELLTMLVERVNKEYDTINLTSMLLRRVIRAAIKCPAFTPIMKDDIVYIGGVEDQLAKELGVPPFAYEWCELWCVGPKPGIPHDVLLWYIAIIREETEEPKRELSLAERAERGPVVEKEVFFGKLKKYLNYGPGINKKTLAEMARVEWGALEKILRNALTPGARRLGDE